MVNLIKTFTKLGFKLQEDGTYLGESANRNPRNEEVMFSFEHHYLICKTGQTVLFSILFENLSVGTLIVLLQEYGIFHERYVYERVEHIEEIFEESDYDEDDN